MGEKGLWGGRRYSERDGVSHEGKGAMGRQRVIKRGRG